MLRALLPGYINLYISEWLQQQNIDKSQYVVRFEWVATRHIHWKPVSTAAGSNRLVVEPAAQEVRLSLDIHTKNTIPDSIFQINLI